MKYYVAPLEGITGYVFRNTHKKYFPIADKYYMPFVAPTQNHKFSGKELADISLENNQNIQLIPQILTKSSDDFIWAMNEMVNLGYEEINLNVGCPSGTVVAKGKGSGLLKDLNYFEMFLDEIFSAGSGKISIKTRIGLEGTDEFYKIMELYNKYPIKELTIHPRLQQDFYKNSLKIDIFKEVYKTSKNPICYNGDILSKADAANFEKDFPDIKAIMIGRGLIKNPSLISDIKGEFTLNNKILKEFHDELFSEYTIAFQSENNAMMRMKELWSHMIYSFENPEKLIKNIKKCKDAKNFTQITNEVFNHKMK